MTLDPIEPDPRRVAITLGTAASADPVLSEAEHLKTQLAEYEAHLHERIAVLAEVERMAHFRNWSFDLLARHPDFSGETRRLLGLVQRHRGRRHLTTAPTCTPTIACASLKWCMPPLPRARVDARVIAGGLTRIFELSATGKMA